MTTSTATKTLRRGDRAILKAWRPEDCERVRVVRAENITVGIGATKRLERWLHVEFADGRRILAHPSNLMEEID